MDHMRNEIFQALNIAVDENGYKAMLEWKPEAIASDLIDHNSDFEGHEIEELVPHIQAWLDEKFK